MRFETLADYRCDEVDGCGTLGQSGKQAKFIRLPQILVIVLNRFRHMGESAKIRLPVVVTRFLAITKEGADGSGTEYETFEIYCAVIHCGPTLDSGHYKVVGKPLTLGTQAAQPFNSNWFSFDDARITATTFTAFKVSIGKQLQIDHCTTAMLPQRDGHTLHSLLQQSPN